VGSMRPRTKGLADLAPECRLISPLLPLFTCLGLLQQEDMRSFFTWPSCGDFWHAILPWAVAKTMVHCKEQHIDQYCKL
jgi:hypothetical protein